MKKIVLDVTSMVSDFTNEITDILYFLKIPFKSDALRFANLFFILLRPVLIIAIAIYGVITLVQPFRKNSGL